MWHGKIIDSGAQHFVLHPLDPHPTPLHDLRTLPPSKGVGRARRTQRASANKKAKGIQKSKGGQTKKQRASNKAKGTPKSKGQTTKQTSCTRAVDVSELVLELVGFQIFGFLLRIIR